MRILVNPLTVSLLAAAGLMFPASVQAEESTLVDCSQKRFQSGTSAYTLMGWSKNEYSKAKQRADAKEPPLERVCRRLIDMRGDAHCQEPKNADYRKALLEAKAVCVAPPTPESKKEAPAKSSTVAPSPGASPVDCSEKKFQSGSSVRALMSWSSKNYQDALASKGSGIYPKSACNSLISRRGSAHCKQPANREILEKLKEGLALCDSLANPAPATEKMLVDCSEKRFKKTAPVPEMIKWSRSMVTGLAEWSDVAAKAKCEEAYDFAGSAHCRLPAEESPRQAVHGVIKACAVDEARREAAVKAAADAETKRIADAKANRKIVRMPQVRFKGSKAGLAKKMQKALLAAGVAKATSEIGKISPMGSWKTGRYTDTKLPYRKASGLVLWNDKDGDGVCRFTGYNFIQTKKGKRWSPLGFQSFCNGCPEGWTKCKKSKAGR